MRVSRLLLSAAAALTLVTALPVLAQSKDEVEEAQKILMLMGKFSKRPTGEMTDATASALRDFQREAKLPQSGRADAATLTALREIRDTRYSKGLSLPTAQQQAQARAQAALPPPKPVAVPQQQVESQGLGGSVDTLTGYGQRGGSGAARPPAGSPQATGGTGRSAQPNNAPPAIFNRPSGTAGAGNPPALPQEAVGVERMYTGPNVLPPARVEEDPGISRFWPWSAAVGILAIFGWIFWRGFISSGASSRNPYLVGSAAAELSQSRREPGF